MPARLHGIPALAAFSLAACAPSPQLSNPGGAAFDQAGFAVAIEGDRVIVGVPKSDSLDSNGGKALIYERSGSAWPLRATIASSTPTFGAQFGWSVDIAGDRAAVGAFGDATVGWITGAAYVFEGSGTVWAQVARVHGDSTESGFAKAIAISGDWLVVGAPFAPPPLFTGPGLAFVYRRNNAGQWVRDTTLVASDAIDFIEFGSAVDIDGDVIVVGAEKGVKNGTVIGGAVYVFRRNGGAWLEEAKLTASDAAYHDRFGASVSVSGDAIIVGAKQQDTKGDGAGAAYAFRRFGGFWTQVQKLTANDGGPGNEFGYAVSVDQPRALIGAWLADGDTGTTGATFLYTGSPGAWSFNQKRFLPTGVYGDGYGASVSVSGDCAVVGAPNRDVGGLDKMGAAFVYCGLPALTVSDIEIDIICCVEIPDPVGPVILSSRIVNGTDRSRIGTRRVVRARRDGGVEDLVAPLSLVLAPGDTIDERHTLRTRSDAEASQREIWLLWEDPEGTRTARLRGALPR